MVWEESSSKVQLCKAEAEELVRDKYGGRASYSIAMCSRGMLASTYVHSGRSEARGLPQPAAIFRLRRLTNLPPELNTGVAAPTTVGDGALSMASSGAC
ncbi:hypothetical protein NDU88_002194 [Pleurodeles waltl]|uniref:Uncharacterized protein n=1 Tax=Pleurodeles waltl TaxID=8319 RepID=A0AAV7KUX0_PLEWA|nr:hypothetical protein NDU88_002194 [Pleurodeles waltl]